MREVIVMERIILETERLKLVPLSLEHKEELFKFWSNESVTEFMNIQPFKKITEVENMINLLVNLMQENQASRYTIILKEKNVIIGTCGLNYIDHENQRTEIAYDLGKNFWHQGYGIETMTAFIRWCIKEYNFHRIEAKVDINNHASKNLLLKLSFIEEGILRDYEKVGSVYHNICMFSYINKN